MHHSSLKFYFKCQSTLIIFILPLRSLLLISLPMLCLISNFIIFSIKRSKKFIIFSCEEKKTKDELYHVEGQEMRTALWFHLYDVVFCKRMCLEVDAYSGSTLISMNKSSLSF